jgi:hypothetical protein
MRLLAAVAIAMAASVGAWADTPASGSTGGTTGAQWDDSHMQSRHQDTPRTSRPHLTGESGYGALASGNATASAPTVQELEFTSQREWEQGALSTGSKAKAEAAASASQSSTSGAIPRGSALRAGAVSQGRRGH